MMFDPDKKRIAPKKVGDVLLRQGKLMRLTADTETTGFVRSDTPYSTPAFPAITEWGDCLTDFAGNYLNSAQIFPRRPEGKIAQPGAVLLQRFSGGPKDIESLDLDPYWIAIAKVVWRLKQAANAYDQLATSDEREFIKGTDFNKQMTSTEMGYVPGEREFSEEVIPIPLIDEDSGNIVYDYRWHPLRKKLSYRLGKDEFEDNIYYKEKDGSRWKWVDVDLGVRFFNRSYDIPIVRAALQSLGYSTNDATFLYTGGNTLMDTRDLVYATAIYGPQGEDGLKLGELIDPVTGKLRRSEAQTAVMEKAMKHMNGIRMLMGGPLNINDGSFADLVMAHGAHVDAIMTASLENHCMDLAPWLYANHAKQADEKTLVKQVLTRKASADGKKLPVFSLPMKIAGKYHTESMYRFLDTDDQMGRFKRLVFLHTDGNFHKGTNAAGKPFKEMSKDEWVDYLSLGYVKDNPNKPVRVISVNKFPAKVDYSDLFRRSSKGRKWRGKLAEIEKDILYIDENPEMQENIRAAQAEIQAGMRYGAHYPQVPLMEDELPHLFAGGVPYIDDPESVRYQDSAATPHPMVKTIQGRMNDAYSFMNEVDNRTNILAVRAHIIDSYKDYYVGDNLKLYHLILRSSTQIDKLQGIDLNDQEHGDHKKALKAFTDFKKDIEDKYKTRTTSAGDERTLFDDMIDPNTGKSFFDKDGNARIKTLEDALRLRRVMRMQLNLAVAALDDFKDEAQDAYEKEIRKIRYPYQDIVASILSDYTLEPFFDTPENSRSTKRKVSFESPRDAVDFRTKLGKRIMDDYLGELTKKTSKIATGKVDQSWSDEPESNHGIHRILFASPDNGEKGSTPHIIDEHGRELDIEYLKQQDEKYVLQKLRNREWTIDFYRLRSEIDTLRLLKRFTDLEMQDQIPEKLYKYMYFANLMHELWCIPNETADTARTSNLETFELELERLELAASTKNPKLIERSENPLLADAAKAVQFEEGQRIMQACREWLEDMKMKYPKPTFESAPELIKAGRHDPKTNMPFDYIGQKITRDPTKAFLEDGNYVVVDVPAYHLRYHVETREQNLPNKGIVVPNLDKQIKTAVKRGKPVVFREIETGRIYSGGNNSVHDIAKKDEKRYSIILEKAAGDYARAGQEFNDDDTITYIGIEDLYPLANTRYFEKNVQSFKLPGAQFDALTFPKFSAFSDTPITTLILPTDYSPQKLEPGKLLRLRDTAGEVFSNMNGTVNPETGHIYDTKLLGVDGMDGTGKVTGKTIEEICDTFRHNQNNKTKAILDGSGFAGVDHLFQRLNQWRADGWKTPDQKLLVAHFAPVNENYFTNGRDETLNMWGFFNALSAPDAAFAVNGHHPSPSAYRDDSWETSNEHP